ncbi:MAG: hypothetical protein JW936_04220 [Sedimentisphaerales bacterium]|nr:hypothetical protein [Sedimentisphaerales bacterium]
MIKIMQVGLGPIGQQTVRFATKRQELQYISAVDPAPDKAGRNLAQLCQLDTPSDVLIDANLETALKKGKPDIAILTTVSNFNQAADQAEAILKHGIAVVSTCEEMAYPWLTMPARAKQLDEVAKKYGAAVLGTGVNPGFLMDSLALTLTAACQNVESVQVSRIQNASVRRMPFQQKIGAGLTLDEFEAKRQTGTLRHVGLTESMHMIAAKIGWKLDRTEDVLSPIVAEHDINEGYVPIKAGMAAGVQQIGRGYAGDKELITLVFRAAVGLPESVDQIEIVGTPSITSTIPGGVNGDIATCAITVNAIKSVLQSPAGLRTMTDCTPIACFL